MENTLKQKFQEKIQPARDERKKLIIDHGDKVIGDINYSSPVIDKRQNQINYPFWMKIDKKRNQ